MNKGYKQILFTLLCGLPLGLIVYALGGGANFIISAAVLPILGYFFLAAVGITCVSVEEKAAPKSTVILSWVLVLVIALSIFLLSNLLASAVSLLVIALLMYIYRTSSADTSPERNSNNGINRYTISPSALSDHGYSVLHLNEHGSLK